MRACVVACTVLFLGASLGNASILTYSAILDGAAEAPPNASPGSGGAQVVIDTVADTMSVSITFADLLGTTTASHIHCCTAVAGTGTAAVATQTPFFVGFPLGVTSGSYSHTFDLTLTSSYSGSFVAANGGTAAGAEAALLAGMAAGEAYLNVHSNVFPGGEIRGFLAPVPEPATFGLLGGAVAGLTALRRCAHPA